MSLKLKVKVLSAAKRVNLKKFELYKKSLNNIRSNRGQIIEPWGTPDFIVETVNCDYLII